VSNNNIYQLHQGGLLVAALITEVAFWSGAWLFYAYLTQTAAETFRFEHEWVVRYLWPIILLFILSFFYIATWRNSVLKKLGTKRVVRNLFVGYSPTRLIIRYILWRFGLSFLLLAAANPQFGTAEREVESKGIEIMLALDVSNSMLAEDLAPNYSRLKVTKMAIEKLLDKLSGDHVGLVVFAGAAYKHLPITPDYNAAKLFLQNINTGMISAQGTDIGNAIHTCLTSFNFDNGVTKVIVIFSDGEDHEQTAIDAASVAKENGVIIHTIGMGGELGAPIPILVNGQKKGNKKDAEGNTVLTKLNEQMMIEVATAGGGSYTRANGLSVGLDGLMDQLNAAEKTALQKDKFTIYDDHFQLFLLLGSIFLVMDIFMVEKRLRGTSKLLHTL
jgi:Ca-activated chloride channel homolog